MLEKEDGFFLKIEDISQILIDSGIKKLYKQDDIIISQGEVFKGSYIILKGKVLAISFSEDGGKKIHAIIEPFSSIGGSHTIISYESPFDLICLSQVELLYIGKEKLIEILKDDFDIQMTFIKSATKMLNNFCYQSGENVFYKSESRICNLLTSFAKHYGVKEDNKIKINFDLRIKFICDIVGVNKLTVIRTFNKLKDVNLIEKNNGYYYINNLDLLEKYSTIEDVIL